MNKKIYLIIPAVVLIFVIVMIVILLSGNKQKNDWTTEIREAQNYQILMTNCNGRQKDLNSSTLDTLSQNWNSLSNNGPWTGDTTECYTTVTFSYEKNGIVKQKKILIIDDSTLVLSLDTNTIYYTNAEEIIKYLNGLFIA